MSLSSSCDSRFGRAWQISFLAAIGCKLLKPVAHRSSRNSDWCSAQKFVKASSTASSLVGIFFVKMDVGAHVGVEVPPSPTACLN